MRAIELKSVVAALLATSAWTGAQELDVTMSAPKSIAITAYDTGVALVRERRQVRLGMGENKVRINQLPARLIPETVSLRSAVGASPVDVTQQEFAYDLEKPADILRRYLGRRVTVTSDGQPQDGLLLSGPVGTSTDAQSLALRTADGSVLIFPTTEDIDSMLFPQAKAHAYLEPTLLWRTQTTIDQDLNLNVNYSTRGIGWKAYYELLLGEQGGQGLFGARVELINQSGGDYVDARWRLVATERGREQQRHERDATRRPRAQSVLRYTYGQNYLELAGMGSQMPIYAQRLPRPVTLERGERKFITLFDPTEVTVRRIFVYDGVRFDRFQRNKRHDWNYGTEFSEAVDSYVEFDTPRGDKENDMLAPGLLRVYQRKNDGAVDWLGSGILDLTVRGKSAHALLGPARGLRGERERTGYREIVPLHEYEESFEIRLWNDSDEDREVRVNEHLYRWNEYEITKADTEYEETEPGVIEFRVLLKPDGQRTVHYTVRYIW